MSKGVMWGQGKETGVWLAPKSRWRMLLRSHDALFVAAGRWRMRAMKPRWLAR